MDLPSVVDDLTRLFQGYGAKLTVGDLQNVAEKVGGFAGRGAIQDNGSAFAVFAFKGQNGEMLIEFPQHQGSVDHPVRAYTRGEITLTECSKIGSGFFDAFEEIVLPSESHAAEPLRN